MPPNQLEKLEKRHAQLVRILIEIETARNQIAVERGEAGVNNTIAASFAAVMVVSDIVRIALSAIDERAEIGFSALDRVLAASGAASRDDAMDVMDVDLSNASRIVGFVRDAKSLFETAKKLKGGKSSKTAEQLGLVADVGLAMTDGFMLLYGALRSGQSTISSAQAAYARATTHYNKVRDQILQIKAQMDAIVEEKARAGLQTKIPHKNFPEHIQRAALARQKHRCASCETKIHDLGNRGRAQHEFGEGARAHHIIPHEGMNGPLTVENCVIICSSCHYSAHVGGDWRNVKIYDDIKHLPMNEQIRRIAALYPHYRG